MKRRAAPAPRLRPLDAPAPVQVRAGAYDTPEEIRLSHAVLRVVSIRERWRIDDEWWRHPIHRLYHQVVLEDGRVLTLYRDLVDGRWYLHGRGAASGRHSAGTHRTPGARPSRVQQPASRNGGPSPRSGSHHGPDPLPRVPRR